MTPTVARDTTTHYLDGHRCSCGVDLTANTRHGVLVRFEDHRHQVGWKSAR